MMKVKRFICSALLLVALLVTVMPVAAAQRVDVNTATVEQLVEIKGVGAVLAERIVAYRQTHGAFKSLDELENVKGVGSKTLEKMLPYLLVSKN